MALPGRHHGKPRRLPGHDYAACGEYFITVCTRGRACRLGSIVGCTLALSTEGVLVEGQWRDLENRFPFLRLDEFVVMPNHIHGILQVHEDAGVHLDRVLQAFKSLSTLAVNRAAGGASGPLWQRGYYERVIRDDRAMERVRKYIRSNPERWPEDPLHPDRP